MSPHILSLPAELLSQILSLLPVLSLLRFSQTSRYSHTLASANLHTLSLGIAPWPSTHHPQSASRPSQTYASWLQIPNAAEYGYTTLFNFQSALVTSILHRHAPLLQHIDLSIWTLSVAAATALRHLHALRTLALRFESGGLGPGVPRSYLAAERAEQRKAWAVLARRPPPVWSARLAAIRLVNAGIETKELGALLGASAECREVVLERCSDVGSAFWAFVRTWSGREGVRVLELKECGGCVGEEAVGAIGGLKGLEVCFLFFL